MQFKHPEILFALLLLIIPVIVHLFQLQRFVKVPFTNVKFLKKIVLETRKSSQLKKWLILLTRMLLFSSLILAFSQPYFSEKNSNEKVHTIIYLDNSLSLSYKNNQQEILKKTAQEIIENLPTSGTISLFTNDQTFMNINTIDLKNKLLNLDYSVKDLPFSEILLKINQLATIDTSALREVVLITDFQLNKKLSNLDVTNVNSSISLINSSIVAQNNYFIDSVYVSEKNNSEIDLSVIIKSTTPSERDVSISLFNNSKLAGKATALFNKNSESIVNFKIPFQQNIKGKLLLKDENLLFDNTLFFTISKPEKINVFSIGKSTSFIPKIYTQKEFNFQHKNLTELNYDLIQEQHIIILNEIDNIPFALSNLLDQFCKNGGTLVIIPSKNTDIDSYNILLNQLNLGTLSNTNEEKLDITKINYSHPLFAGVFENEVQNFQYPYSNHHFKAVFNSEKAIVLYENQQPFLSQINLNYGNIYWFNSPLNKEISNFQSSPLVVPIFYNFSTLSLAPSNLYYTIGKESRIDIPIKLQNDHILKIRNAYEEIIPLQQAFNNKVHLFTNDAISTPGFYDILDDKNTIKSIAFNHNRKESELKFTAIDELFGDNPKVSISRSIETTFAKLNEQQEINSLFKWFLALAIVFLLLEICILKFLKV